VGVIIETEESAWTANGPDVALEHTQYESTAEDEFPSTPAYDFSGNKVSRFNPGGGTVNLELAREPKHFFDINYTGSIY
jgi:hypothetical protein